MAFLDDLGTYLAANGHGTLDVDLHLTSLPDDPAFSATLQRAVYDYGSAPAAEVFSSDAYQIERCQIVVRSTDYQQAKAEGAAIRALLHDVANQTINGTYYLRLFALNSAPFPLGPADDAHRWRLACNYEGWRVP